MYAIIRTLFCNYASLSKRTRMQNRLNQIPHPLFAYVILIHSDHFYSASSSPLLLRSAPDTARILCRSFASKRHRQLQVKDLPKVHTRPSTLNQTATPRLTYGWAPMPYHCINYIPYMTGTSNTRMVYLLRQEKCFQFQLFIVATYPIFMQPIEITYR